ncbi:GFA family protein [Ruegeria lacuscaerulensis]|uniref:GFA family protein n=1 Tax=Ruegeria lacuscaerulensis TaxID=55218 RepID=UPI0014809E1F|nr:GFA family protein [Ruegeria lacuscaerulensis]
MASHPDMIDGQCICGAVRYRVQDNMTAFKLCYCNFCKKASGSAHVANAFTTPDRIEWLEGQEQLTSFNVPNSQVRRVFCRSCGTSLPFKTQNGKFLVVPVGSLSRPPSQPVSAIVGWASRPAWYNEALGLEGVVLPLN